MIIPMVEKTPSDQDVTIWLLTDSTLCIRDADGKIHRFIPEEMIHMNHCRHCHKIIRWRGPVPGGIWVHSATRSMYCEDGRLTHAELDDEEIR